MMTAVDTRNAAEIAFALGKAKRSGDGFVCKCPAHDDRHASLSITQTSDGKLLWKCHAGCSQDAVFEALKKKGLLSEPQPRRQSSGPRRIVKSFDYHDETGKLLFQVVRFEPKSFAQRIPDPSQRDGWRWGLNGVRPALYRLPEVAKASTVFIVEGEKDVENLVGLDVCATTSPMGADKWRPWYSQALKGKHLVFIPDNDEPGREHVRHAVADCLAAGAASVRVLHLPDLEEKGDVSDWIAAGNGRSDLDRLLAHVAPVEAPDLERTPDWPKKLHRTEEGQARSTERNAVIALRYAPQLAGVVRYNAFAMRLETKGVEGAVRSQRWRRWSDTDEIALTIWLQEHGIASIKPGTVGDAVRFYAVNHREVHPIREYLAGLKWDTTERLDHWLIDHLGAVESDFVKAVSRRWMISAVARVMEPGCKADAMLVLEGSQGIGKSTALAALGGEWFSDQLGGDLGSKDAKSGLAGKWIIEHSELAHMNRAAIERVKAFFTEQVDQYRPAYGRNEIEVPRQCVFVGTTNTQDYLRDETGNRRFWPVACSGPCNVDAIADQRDQLWAEAFHRYKAGERWWLEGAELIGEAKREQAARVQDDVWDPVVADWALRQTSTFTTQECIKGALQKNTGDISRSDEMRVSSILRRFGFDKRRARSSGGLFHLWSRKDGTDGTQDGTG